ncbi:hypothetical protein [Arthrobacter sp. 92]|uniref:hypothetical protein n=1 Tax=Arthrobacter sp. 92 TaxID=3418175 RepID=UPI003CFCFE62
MGAHRNTPTYRDSNLHADASTRREPHPAGNTLVDAEFVGSPYCERCGTDEFIYLETFVPAKFRHDGTLRRPGEVTYFCSGCEEFSAHSVPASWVPPGWYFG